MSLLHRLSNTNRNQRIWLVSTGLIVVVANIIYFKDLYYIRCWGDEERVLLSNLWFEVSGIYSLFPYGIREYSNAVNNVCWQNLYSFTGHISFVLIPCALIGLAYIAIEWIKKGESKTSRY
jgi:hypothetical protein